MTAAIVLAAGHGTRFGGGKMLAQIAGRPMLQHVLDLAAAAALDPVVVVLGNDSEQIEAAIEWRTEIRVLNGHPERGISGSLKVGLEAIGDSDSALILLGDQPLLTLDQIRTILSTNRDSAEPVVVPRYGDSQPGNPVLLARSAWPLALALTGDQGMSQLFATRPGLVRYVDVPGRNDGIDTPADRAALSRGGEPARSGRTGAAGPHRP